MRKKLRRVALHLDAKHDLAFVCSPLEFEGSDHVGRFYATELTDWWALSRVDGKLVDNHDFAFGLPKGFRHQVARHATSWETYHHVDPERDIALQLFAKLPMTPAYQSRASTHEQHIRGQFVAWSCPTGQIDELRTTLATIGLAFSWILELSDDNCKRGAILKRSTSWAVAPQEPR